MYLSVPHKWRVYPEHWKSVLNIFLLARICNALTQYLSCNNIHLGKLVKQNSLCHTVSREGDTYLQNLWASCFCAFVLPFPDFINSQAPWCVSGGSLASTVSLRCKGEEMPALESTWTILVVLAWWQPSTLDRPCWIFRRCQFWMGGPSSSTRADQIPGVLVQIIGQ